MLTYGEETNTYHGEWDGAGGIFALLRWLLLKDHGWVTRVKALQEDESLRLWFILYLRAGMTCKVCLSFVTPFVLGLMLPMAWPEYILAAMGAAGLLGLSLLLVGVASIVLQELGAESAGVKL